MTSTAPMAPASTALPVIQRPIDNTALSAFMTCPREYFYGMHQHRRAKGKSAALGYGGMWHRMLEVHYKTDGMQPAVRAILDKEWPEKYDHGIEGDHRTGERAWIDYLGYVKRWGARPSQEVGKTVGWPHAPLVEISVNAMAGRLAHSYAGKIDRVIELGGLGYVEDHKTTSRLDKYFFKQFENSNQMKGYVYLASKLFPEVKFAGVRINVLHLLKGASNYEREIVTYSPSVLEEWAMNTNYWMVQLARSIERYNTALAEGRTEYDAMSLGFPMHFGDNGCSRKFGMCSYHQVCSAAPRIRHKILEQEFEVNPWNPLEVDDAD